MSRLLFTLASLSLASCDRKQIAYVSPEENSQFGRCWTNGKGEFSSFLVLVKATEGYVPYAVSSKCLPKTSAGNEHAAFILATGSLHISDKEGAIRSSAKLDAPLIENTITDLPTPEQSSPVYYITGTARVSNIRGQQSVNITKVKSLNVLDESYLKLAEMGAETRINLASRFDRSLFGN